MSSKPDTVRNFQSGFHRTLQNNYFVLYCDYGILSACVRCCSNTFSLSLCPHFPVFTKLLGKRVFKRYLELFLDSPYFMDWWVIMTLEAIIYKFAPKHFLFVYFAAISTLIMYSSYLHVHTCMHMHTQMSGAICWSLTSLCQLLERMILRGRIKQHKAM